MGDVEMFQTSVSFLDGSFDIENISPLWQENDLSNILNKSNANVGKNGFQIKCSSKIKDSNLSIKNRCVPLATSTPFPIYRQPLLNNNGNVMGDGNKHLNNLAAEPKLARTKIPKRKELKLCTTHTKTSIDANMNINKKLKKSNIPVIEVNNTFLSKSNPKMANKDNTLTSFEKKRKTLKANMRIPRSKLPNAVIFVQKGFTRYGFKICSEGTKKIMKDEQVKAVINKTRVMKNTVEERRYIIQGVRTNRRFQLLMQMRNK